MKASRIGCMGLGLIAVLLVMMVGLVALTMQLPRQTYTAEQQEWLSDNYGRRVRQDAPVLNMYYGYVGSEDKDKAAAAQPVAVGARESHITADMGVRYREREGASGPRPARRAEGVERYCIHCGQRMAGGFKFCPACGEAAQATRACKKCGLEYMPGEELPGFCPACGEKLA